MSVTISPGPNGSSSTVVARGTAPDGELDGTDRARLAVAWSVAGGKGKIEPAGGAFAPAGRVLDALATIGDAGVVEGHRLLRAGGTRSRWYRHWGASPRYLRPTICVIHRATRFAIFSRSRYYRHTAAPLGLGALAVEP
jgi:hypothetical protein